MAKVNDIIENPVTGERIRFVETAAQTNGARLTIELSLSPNAHNAASHLHNRQLERIRIERGELRIVVGDVEPIAVLVLSERHLIQRHSGAPTVLVGFDQLPFRHRSELARLIPYAVRKIVVESLVRRNGAPADTTRLEHAHGDVRREMKIEFVECAVATVARPKRLFALRQCFHVPTQCDNRSNRQRSLVQRLLNREREQSCQRRSAFGAVRVLGLYFRIDQRNAFGVDFR